MTQAISPYAELVAERDALLKEVEELRKYSVRYHWLHNRFTGYDFNWMPSEALAFDGKVCAVFDVGENFRGGKDITAAIDAAMKNETP